MTPLRPLTRRHLVFGWWCLLGFLVLGLALEVLHGLKIGWYLDVSNATRREMWTLAHAHGTLAGLVNLGYAWTSARVADRGGRTLTSGLLLSGSVALPAGFLLGGVVVHGGDPGIGVVLVPVGAVLLALGVLRVALEAGRS